MNRKLIYVLIYLLLLMGLGCINVFPIVKGDIIIGYYNLFTMYSDGILNIYFLIHLLLSSFMTFLLVKVYNFISKFLPH